MTVFYGARDLLETTGAITRTKRRRWHWRRAWSLYGPVLLMAAGFGLYLGALLACEFGP